MMQTRPRRTLILLNWIILATLALASASVRGTWATYSSQEVSAKNSFRGGSIELSVSSIVADVLDSDTVYEFEVNNDGHNSLRYKMTVEGVRDDFCESLNLAAQRAGTEVYDGTLSDFTYSSAVSLETDTRDVWKFVITLPQNSYLLEKKSCDVGLRLEAWQDQSFLLGMGWYDERVVNIPSLTIEPVGEDEEKIEPVILDYEAKAESIEEVSLQRIESDFLTESSSIVESESLIDLVERATSDGATVSSEPAR